VENGSFRSRGGGTLEWSLRLISSIKELLEETIETCRSLAQITYRRVAERFGSPTKTEHLVKAGIAERRTAAKYLRQLEELGVLSSFKAWRETIFVNTGLVKVLKE
jgi:predicted AAA+ superfamily ATPase